MHKRKARPAPSGGWVMYEKYCPGCKKSYSWSYERCKICGQKLVAKKSAGQDREGVRPDMKKYEEVHI